MLQAAHKVFVKFKCSILQHLLYCFLCILNLRCYFLGIVTTLSMFMHNLYIMVRQQKQNLPSGGLLIPLPTVFSSVAVC